MWEKDKNRWGTHDALPEELAEADVDDADVEVLVAEAIAKSPVLPRTSLMSLTTQIHVRAELR